MTDRSGSPLSPDNWRRAQAILCDVLDLPPSRQVAALDAACVGQPELRTEIESLLRAHSQSAGFLETLDVEAVAALIRAVDDDLEVHDVIGPYRIEGRLGRGGMGVVYRGKDTRLGRTVALKFLPQHLSSDDNARQRLVAEARAAAALNHPNIGVVHEIGESDSGQMFIAMACYDGLTLRHKIEAGALAVSEAAAIGRQIAAGLTAAHARGITHRDIKPSNIIVSDDGVARIVDFGIASIAGSSTQRAGFVPGTIAYMSPEQLHGDPVDHTTDVWSLGVVIWEMLTGERPFRGTSDAAIMHAIRTADTGPLRAAPAPLRAILEACLSLDPAARPTAARLTDRLREVEISLRPRRKASAGLFAALVILILVAGYVATRSGPTTMLADGAPIAVFPFAPTSPDTSLDRIGRDLVVILSSTLRDAGGLATVEASTVLAQLEPGRTPLMPQQLIERARQLGAGRVVLGTLLRSNGTLRADATLWDVDGSAMVNVSATAASDDLAVLTDSVTSALLRQVWRIEARSLPDKPSLTTRPLPALRAYVEGEQALARSDFVVAVSAFERAFEADSSFWFAYWRSLYPRVREGAAPADTGHMRQVYERRAAFPRPDQLLLESRFTPSHRIKSTLLRDVTREFPHYWPGWFDYANYLVHFGPFDGSSYDIARAALERVVELNPGFSPAWEHLLWIAIIQRDTSLARRSRERANRPDFAPVYRALHEILLARGELPDSTARRIAVVAADQDAGTIEQAATGFMPFGFPRAQVKYAGIVATRAAAPEVAAEYRWGRATGWAARGAWDSAFVDLDRAKRLSPTDRLATRAYGLAVLGAVLGGVAPATAARQRPDFDPLQGSTPVEAIAARTWMDGVLAALRREPAAVAAARQDIAASASLFGELFDQSLEALEQHARGETTLAANALADLEERNAGRALHTRFGAHHPFVPAIQRMLASDGLLASGDTTRAAHLLSWHEAILWSDFYPVEIANRIAEPVALFRRALIEEQLDQVGPARQHYTAFLERYDLPPAAHAVWIAQAIEGLGRVGEGKEP